jgi:poly-gamma-glutamate capsule biosynthesis protein CapA/YwtB (metallophosphatase superfamily)
MQRTHKIFVCFFILTVLACGAFLLRELYLNTIRPTNAEIAINEIKKQKPAEQNKISDQQIKNKKPIKIFFVGDLMLDRYIRKIAEKKGYPYIFEKIRGHLKEADLAVANLEGPITDNISASIGTAVGEKNHLIFTFDKSISSILSESNIKLVNIGNNHILNFGKDGVDQTKNNLTSANINYFGETGDESKTYIASINGYKIGFVNYNQFSSRSPARTLDNIKNIRNQSDILIVYAHWGMEYQARSNQAIRELGHRFIDSGADLVIGSHPHVIEEKEEYKGHMIYYSLGNFIFDQYFSSETKKGLAVEVTISAENKIEYNDIPLILDNNGQTRIDAL